MKESPKVPAGNDMSRMDFSLLSRMDIYTGKNVS
jgi:hypothetical protein